MSSAQAGEEPHGLAARWPVRPLDIDPFHLPAQYTLSVQSLSGGLLGARDRIEIARRFVAVEREVLGARAVRKRLALSDFSGVAIRAEIVGRDADRLAISVNLHHEDPGLCIPLHMAFDMCAVTARWQSWGKALGLPLLLPALDETWREPVERLGKLIVAPPFPRDPRLALHGRRSVFSAIRELGEAGPMPVHAGVEIIARN